MSNPATRTYAENIDGYLDEYRVNDLIRDIDYNTTKVKELAQSVYPDFPGFVSLPNIYAHPDNKDKIFIDNFIAIRSDGDPIIFINSGIYGPSDYMVDYVYYITVQKGLKATDETRNNLKQNNIVYNYVLQEYINIIFTEKTYYDQQLLLPDASPYKDICLGSIVIKYNETSNEYNAIYSDEFRSPYLKNLQDIYKKLEDYKIYAENRFLIKEDYIPTTGLGGNIIRNPTGKVGILTPDKYISAGLNAEGFISGVLVDWQDNLGFSLTVNSMQTVLITHKFKEMHTLTINELDYYKVINTDSKLYGSFRLSADGYLQEVITSYNLRSSENPECYDTVDCLYVDSSLTNSGNIELKFKNNYSNRNLSIGYKLE